MKESKRGFTLVEVAIFLGITGLLFLGVTAGVQASIYQQRRNDSIENFIEFLRGVYSGVENVQNDPIRGNSEKAVYGKLVTFGETVDLAGNTLSSGNQNRIYVYTVVGNVVDTSLSSGCTLSSLNNLAVNVVDNGNLAKYAYEYIPKWGAVIEPACTGSTCDFERFKGALLIVRNPSSGAVQTFYTTAAISVNKTTGLAAGWIKDFQMQDADFCVNPTGDAGNRDLTDIRIVAGASNASGIERISDDQSRCRAHS